MAPQYLHTYQVSNAPTLLAELVHWVARKAEKSFIRIEYDRASHGLVFEACGAATRMIASYGMPLEFTRNENGVLGKGRYEGLTKNDHIVPACNYTHHLPYVAWRGCQFYDYYTRQAVLELMPFFSYMGITPCFANGHTRSYLQIPTMAEFVYTNRSALEIYNVLGSPSITLTRPQSCDVPPGGGQACPKPTISLNLNSSTAQKQDELNLVAAAREHGFDLTAIALARVTRGG